MRNARAFPLLPAALASVPFGFVLVRVRVLRPSTTAVLQMPTLKGDDWTDEECAPKGATQPAETVAAAGQTSMPDSKNYEGIDALVANFNNLHEFR